MPSDSLSVTILISSGVNKLSTFTALRNPAFRRLVACQLRLLNPNVLLLCVFMVGVGFAFNAPAWSAFVSDVVAAEELPSAATLGGLQLNVSGIVGPALGGLLLYVFGANWVFAVNAICFVGVILAL
jgi:MFS family permease